MKPHDNGRQMATDYGCVLRPRGKRGFTAVIGVLAVVAALCLAVPARSQNQPGRFLVSPRHNIILQCNLDGSNCFHVTGAAQTAGDPGGGDQMVSSASQPSIANDGTIAFTALYGVDGTCSPGAQGICQSHTFLMNADGTNVRQITFNPSDASQFGGDNYAAISPDGTMVAFISNRDIAAYDTNNNPIYMYAVFVVNADGSGLRRVTPFTNDASGNPHGDMYSVAWSPDSKKLAFKGGQYGTFCGTYFGSPIEFLAVGTINVDGTGETYLACDSINAAGGAVAIDWSPDGTLIADARDSVHFGEPAIRITDLTGPNRYPSGLSLSQLGVQYSGGSYSGEFCAADRHCFHFSPDSTQLAYENNGPSDNPTFYGISTINLDGTGRDDTASFGTTYNAYGLQYGMWWAPGPPLPTAAQITLAPNPVEVWPGFSQQLTPTLVDANNNLIMHTASAYHNPGVYYPTCTIQIGPYGLAMFGSVNSPSVTTPSISAGNEGATSNSIPLKCWTSPPCTYTISHTSESFGTGGGSGTVTVTADPGSNNSTCPWHAATNASWITITSFTGGGNGSVSFSVAANTGSARQGTITIAGSTFTVFQNAPPDIVWQDATSGDVYLWTMNGTTQTGGTYVAQGMSPWQVVGTPDLTGDGKPDLIWQHPTSGDVYLWTMNATTQTGGTYVARNMAPWKVVATGDFCGSDAKPDIVWQHETTGDVYLWCMDGTTVTSGMYLAQSMGLWKVVAAADLNGDGKPDLLWQHATSGDVYVWFMNGTTQTSGAYLASGLGSWKVVATTDLNGDGQPDLVWQDATTSDVYMWLMNGTTVTGGAYLARNMGSWKVVGPK